MAELNDNPTTPPLPAALQGTGFDVTLLGDVDVSRFLSKELTANSREVAKHQISVNPGLQEARIAVVPVIGVLTKYGSWSGPSTLQLAGEVTQLANSGVIDGILLLIDSPGGEAAFVYDAIDAIRAAGQKIPIHARISDLGASGGYALACACSSVSVNDQGSVGCIGTYIAIQDWSAYMQKLGVKTYVIAAEGGTFKGTGTFGTELTAEQQDYIKQRADALNQLFLKTVSTGRRMSLDQAAKLADGRVHIGAEALKLGLVDAVCSLESSLQTLAIAAKPKALKTSSRGSQKEGPKMEPATFEELEQALPKAFGEKASAEDAQWGMKLMKSKPTLDAARQAWNNRLEEKLEAQQAAMQEQVAAAAKQAADAAAGKPKLPGVTLPKQSGGDGAKPGAEDLVQEYHDEILSVMKEERLAGDGSKVRCTRMEAAVEVNRRRPDLHQAYLLSINSDEFQTRLINSKFKVEGPRARA